MTGSWTKEEERLLLQLRSEATVNEELSGTSADAAAYDSILQKLHQSGVEKTKTQMLNKLKYIKRKWLKIKCHNKTSGKSKKTMANEDICFLIWGHRALTEPVNLVSSISRASGASRQARPDDAEENPDDISSEKPERQGDNIYQGESLRDTTRKITTAEDVDDAEIEAGPALLKTASNRVEERELGQDAGQPAVTTRSATQGPSTSGTKRKTYASSTGYLGKSLLEPIFFSMPFK